MKSLVPNDDDIRSESCNVLLAKNYLPVTLGIAYRPSVGQRRLGAVPPQCTVKLNQIASVL
jgi:hypothetical protein